METLSTYYRNGLPARQTARALYLQHNTVAYRLGRIEELLNRRLDDVTSSIDILIALPPN
ncbi:helix-turn-helix domain-containing protein [Paenarthrobacter sp. NPDC058040]|uniref:helix-turn-helix domain-containing protein n=1 Tax=unclassified Paenarthrobacter TaxID=2634190 RepID=UPI0036DD78BA